MEWLSLLQFGLLRYRPKNELGILKNIGIRKSNDLQSQSFESHRAQLICILLIVMHWAVDFDDKSTIVREEIDHYKRIPSPEIDRDWMLSIEF
jgi:hypothetical protein